MYLLSLPHRAAGGNSDILCDSFAEGARKAGHSVSKVFLADKKIAYCTGCGACNSSHKCVIKDDMADILDAMVKADVIVLATPVYFYSMTGQLKTMIDRTVPRYTEISNKEFYFIITAADSSHKNMQRTLEGIRGFTEGCLDNPVEKGILYGTGAWQKGEVSNMPVMREAFEMGNSIK